MKGNKKKDLTIVSYYYPPETGAAANRISRLASSLQKSYNVTVVCPMPNYPTGKVFAGYRRRVYLRSTENRITIVRLWVFPTKSNKIYIRLLSLLSFSVSLIVYFFKQRNGVLFVNSPPISVPLLLSFFLMGRRRMLVLNVSDLWPMSGQALGKIKSKCLISFLTFAEARIYRKATLILGQSEEALEHIKKTSPGVKTFLYRNYPEVTSKKKVCIAFSPLNPIRIIYAGLIGAAQGLVQFCQNVELFNIELHIYGDGTEKDELVSWINQRRPNNIVFHGLLSHDDVCKKYDEFDVALVALSADILGALPSKIFELALHGIPVIYFANGEATKIIEDKKLGYVVECGDYIALNKLLRSIDKQELFDMRNTIRATALKNFNFERQYELLEECLKDI